MLQQTSYEQYASTAYVQRIGKCRTVTASKLPRARRTVVCEARTRQITNNRLSGQCWLTIKDRKLNVHRKQL